MFDEWTHQNTWALGLLMADGSVGSNSRPQEFKLYNTDLELVENFKKVFDSDKDVYASKKSKGRYGNKTVYYLMLSNPKIMSFFKTINAHGNKDVRNPFEHIPEEFKWSYIKGVFDGDGNVYEGKLGISGRKHHVELIHAWINNKIDAGSTKLYSATSSDKTFYMQFGLRTTEKILMAMEEFSPNTYDSEKYRKIVLDMQINLKQ